ncbi:CHASE2 domain-containing protein [Oxynema aestuarii]|uniref:CHASE2 domain-containing protein n=1 Tax=Oxynema aestuarii AP17 TaxID=2064643 RepID=A0A6H1TWV9_9CYAN|nr:CHASE2 domain-containing protein [Oxynema aestuarii]QIZ70420.1 CHASE2 domain-containing protein [Oxynema aestuarii AP17]
MIAQLTEKIRATIAHPKSLGQAAVGFGGTVILASFGVAAVVVGVRQVGGLESFELQAYDRLMRSRPDPGPDERLLVVEISEDDIRAQNEYPISDATMAAMLNQLVADEARAIGIDILRDVPIGTGREQLVKVLSENDNIIAACKLSSEAEPQGVPAAPSVPEERIGFADLPVDRDVTIRRTILVSTPIVGPQTEIVKPHLCNYPDPENQLPSLSFSLALMYLQGEGVEVALAENGQDLVLGDAVLKRLGDRSGGYAQTGATDYQLMLNYRSGDNAIEQVKLTDLIEGRVDPETIRDRVVLAGYTASTANDDFATPYSAGSQDRVEMPGVVIHAQATSQLIAAALDGRPLIWYWSQWGEILWIFLWALVGGSLAWAIRRPWVLGVATVGGLAILYGVSYALFLQAGWIPFVPPAIALLGSVGGVVAIDRFNKSAYGQAVIQGVKGFLKIDIEIDQEKKEEQVAEITESDYFKNLQEKAHQLRAQKHQPRSRGDRHLADDGETSETEAATTETDGEEDYFAQLQQRGQQFKHDRPETQPQESAATGDREDGDSEDGDGDDYFAQLRQRSQNLKRDNPDRPES